MTDPRPTRRYRFGIFEADATTGELRRQGVRIRINAQPFQVLLMLLDRPGEILTREEISRSLWSDGTFVDFEHGVNSAVNRIREALGDAASNPRFVETLARRGYRFVAPVERIEEEPGSPSSAPASPVGEGPAPAGLEIEPRPGNGILSTPRDLPETPHRVVFTLFLLLQLMYLGFYVSALAHLTEIQDLLSALPYAPAIFYALIGTAVILIPVRVFVVCAVLFRAPGVRHKFLEMWPYLLIADILWALSPFLLLLHINTGTALACMALLVYSPFAQRSLMLMGAGREEKHLSAPAAR